jgi:hypothetical protein
VVIRDVLRLAMNDAVQFPLALGEIRGRGLVALDLRELLARGLTDILGDPADDDAEALADPPAGRGASAGLDRIGVSRRRVRWARETTARYGAWGRGKGPAPGRAATIAR